MALPTRILPTQSHKLKDLPPWGVLASLLDHTEQEDEAKKFIHGNQKSNALPTGMQHDKDKKRATWLHRNPEQQRITKALMRVIRCETEKNDMNNDKGYVKLWDVVDKNENSPWSEWEQSSPSGIEEPRTKRLHVQIEGEGSRSLPHQDKEQRKAETKKDTRLEILVC